MPFQQYPFKGGIPSGNTAGRPSNPITGDTYYNGQLGILEIWTGSAWFPCSAPPATPINIIATDVSSGDAYTSTSAGKLSISFTAGSGGGNPTNYIAYTTAGGFSTSGSTSPLVITGLTLGTSYAAYVVAQNGFGNAAASGNSASVAPTTKPQAPTIGTASTNSGTTDITVTWTNGNNGGSNLTSITITPYLNGTTAQTSRTAATTSSTSYTFTGASALTMGNSYTFKVKATNANGDSPDSSASNSITVLLPVEYLVVAGGGGNQVGQGGNREAGSGAGGMLASSAAFNIGTQYTVTVGAGGTGRANGANSTISGSGFTTITAYGGGCGGNNDSNPEASGGNGGSGGGAWYVNGSAGTGTSGQGNNGSVGFGGSPYGGAGGGAGSAGGRGTAVGSGAISSITGSSVTYATGGKSNDYPSTVFNTNGTANSGNGADGAANGGSGVVIIRALQAASATTGSPTVTTSGSYTIYKFTGNGSITY